MYFQHFQLINYDSQILTNILARVKIRKDVKSRAELFVDYYIKEQETVEMIADRLYGSSELFWVILLANNIINPYTDLPMDTPALSAFITSKYGDGNEDDIHHYEDSDGVTVLSDYPSAVSVSNRDYEDRINEQKRKIRLILPQVVPQIQDELIRALKR